MYAVIKTGGKQYMVAAGDVIAVEKLPGEVGAEIRFDEVLLLGDDSGRLVGTPNLSDASVSATVMGQVRGDKVIVFKKNRRKNYRRKHGHRQLLTMVRIMDIHEKGGKAPAKAAEKPAAADDKKADAATSEKAPAETKAATKKSTAKSAKSGDDKAATKKKSAAKKSTTKATAKKSAAKSKKAATKKES